MSLEEFISTNTITAGWDSGPTGWNSDPVTDILNWMEREKNRRWVCRSCGFTTWRYPERMVTLEELRGYPNALFYQPLPCQCGALDWEERTDPGDSEESCS